MVALQSTAVQSTAVQSTAVRSNAVQSTKIRLAGACLLLLAVGGVATLTLAQQRDGETPAPETLLPEHAVILIAVDGTDAHTQAWQQTAAFEALHESGLMEAGRKLITGFAAQANDQRVNELLEAAESLYHKGASVGVSITAPGGGPPQPWGVIVLHQAAQYEPMVAMAAREIGGRSFNLDEKTIEGRSVTMGIIPNSPGVEIGWWTEGEHLVMAVGINAVDSALQVATGEAGNITSNPLWEKYRTSEDFEVATLGWLNFAEVRNTLGQFPIPMEGRGMDNPLRVNNLLDTLGLGTLAEIVTQEGYEGRAMRRRTTLIAPGPRKGLLAMLDQEAISLSDLPPLPNSITGLVAGSSDFAPIYDEVLESITAAATELGEPQFADQADRAIADANLWLGFDLRNDLLESLGSTYAMYADPRQGWFFFGGAMVVSVDDARTLQVCVDKLLANIERETGRREFTVRRINKRGHDLIVLEIGSGMGSPTISIGEKWMCIGFTSQAVEAFLLRESGRLPRWEPSEELQASLDKLPKQFTSLLVSDPRASYETLVGWAPSMVGFIQMGARQSGMFPRDFNLPIATADIPPVELVTAPLFPNVTMSVKSEQRIVWESRSSLPSVPLLSGMGGISSAATVPVLVALLLPAVQQGREAARRTQSKNNLKQLALAMHNYHDVWKHFPAGTHPNDQLKPTERLSWLVDLLPYYDEARRYNGIDQDGKWDADANEQLVSPAIPVLTNPGATEADNDHAVTHYVGIAGLGEKGPTLGTNEKGAGMFAYDQPRRIRDVTDGTSNTIMIMEAGKKLGPWAQGGPSTIRPFTKKPYINGPDGFGGVYNGGANTAFVDGSVRFLSEKIDPTVLEAITTIQGSEVVGDF